MEKMVTWLQNAEEESSDEDDEEEEEGWECSIHTYHYINLFSRFEWSNALICMDTPSVLLFKFYPCGICILKSIGGSFEKNFYI